MSVESGSARLEVLVHETQQAAEGVRVLHLRAAEDELLPAWTPGAHVDVVLPSGLVRHYSLCGDVADLTQYRIAVLREVDGRGGSAEVHDRVAAGTALTVVGPKNHFPLVDSPQYLFVAGGIGITPLLPMVRQVSAASKPWQLLYGGRSRASMAFTSEIEAFGEHVRVLPQDEVGLLPLAEAISAAPVGTAIYCCGPEPLLQAVSQLCAEQGRAEDLHFERFAASAELPPAATGEVFEVELKRTGKTLCVPADRSLLDVVRDVLPEVLSDCEEGFCGTCETRVLEGDPDHRDTVLSESEKAAGDTMMICVGRCLGNRLVLDL
jgi:ferredoxin-NADP reductase